MSRHVFATCQVGIERTLKGEVERRHPRLRPAFARPGLVTWVGASDHEPDLDLHAVFARTWGISLGRAAAPDEVVALAAVPTRSNFFTRAAAGEGARLHVYPRDPAADGAVADAAAVRTALFATGKFAAEPRPAAGDLVIDVITAPGEPWLVGAHRHGIGRWAVPGGLPEIDVPADAPSRAYAKLEEAIVWADLGVEAGQVALEIGSAPGGAALALVRRGVTVWSADPAELAPAVLAFRHPSGARVHHLPTKAGSLRLEDLPAKVDWLLLDVHAAPQVALHAIQRILPRVRGSLHAAILTLKLGDQRVIDEVPQLLDRVGKLGFDRVRATQLPSNRREICCVAW